MPGWVNRTKCTVVLARNKEGELIYLHSSNEHSKTWEQFQKLLSMDEVEECRIMTAEEFNKHIKIDEE